MNFGQQSSQQINDDQELAKVLAGVNGASDTAADANEPAMSAMEPPAAPTTPPPAPVDATLPPVTTPEQTPPETGPAPLDPMPQTEAPLPPMPAPIADSGDLGDVKQEAISELRPLVDKLNLPAEEKFDTYLLLIRSTDDKSLIAPAHEAAKNIADEARRAQALLDVIKEIDFLSSPDQATA